MITFNAAANSCAEMGPLSAQSALEGPVSPRGSCRIERYLAKEGGRPETDCNAAPTQEASTIHEHNYRYQHFACSWEGLDDEYGSSRIPQSKTTLGPIVDSTREIERPSGLRQ